jgi:DNA-binding SARP family transcriptional activator
MAEFKVLGALEIVSDGRVCTPTAPKVRQVVALLLLNANKVVGLDHLIAELWDERPPKSAVTTTQTYIYQLRKLIADHRLDPPGRELLVTKASGYVLQVPAEDLDAVVFRQLVREGQQHLDAGRPLPAGRTLRQALDLWQGPALADIACGRSLEPHAVLLEEQRLRALELRITADLQLGLHRELIGELKALVAQHPLNEWFHGQLIRSLSTAGRRSEALQAYQRLRTLLDTELGLDPTPELQQLQLEVLAAAPPSEPGGGSGNA